MDLLKLWLLVVLAIESTVAINFPCAYGYNEHKKYLCMNYYSEISSDVKVDAIVGHHVEGESDNSRVDGLIIFGRKVRRIPKNLFYHFSNLKEIVYTCLNTKGLCLDKGALFKGIFSDAGRVQTISLRGHKFEALKAETFQGVGKLEFLLLTSNFISEVHKDSFKGVNALKLLALNNNQIRNFAAGTFDNLNNLEFLQLQGNDLSTLSKDVFKNMRALKQINLQQNKLTMVDFKFGEHFIQLENVNLIDNRCIGGFFSIGTGNNDLQTLDQSLAACSAVPQFDANETNIIKSLQIRNENLEKDIAALEQQEGRACDLAVLIKLAQQLQGEVEQLMPFKQKYMELTHNGQDTDRDRRVMRRNGSQNNEVEKALNDQFYQLDKESLQTQYQLDQLMTQNRKLINFNDKLNAVADEIIDFMVENVFAKPL